MSALTPHDIGSMKVGELLDRIRAMPLAELAAMSREAVEAMPDHERAVRVERLYADQTVWDADDVAHAAGVKSAAVKKWRNAYLAGLPGGLLRPHNEDTDDIKKPGDGRWRSKDRPKWIAGDVRRWMKDQKIVNVDLFPISRVGRPKGSGSKSSG